MPKVRTSRAFRVAYGGGFCIICGHDVDEGDMGCFYGDEIAHYECAVEEIENSTYIKQFTFDPKEWSK